MFAKVNRAPLAIHFIFLISLALVLGVGCQREQKAEGGDQRLLTAYRLIDAQRDDEAISLLEKLLKEQPSNSDYLTALASAHAHKAGVKIQTLIDGVKAGMSVSKLPKPPEGNLPPNSNLAQKLDFSILSYSRLFVRISSFAEVFHAIPTVSPQLRPHLVFAVETMNKIERPSQAQGLYRAVLKVVYFKMLFSERVHGESNAGAGEIASAKADCAVDFDRLQDSSATLGTLLISLYSDLSIGNPEQRENHRKEADNIVRLMNSIATATSVLVQADSAARVSFRVSILALGFGSLLKCGDAQGGSLL